MTKTETDTRTRTNQPEILNGLPVICHLSIGDGRRVEIRTGVDDAVDGEIFVTVGNLFGSQTVRGEHARRVLDLLAMINNAKRKPQSLPAGMTLLDNAEKPVAS